MSILVLGILTILTGSRIVFAATRTCMQDYECGLNAQCDRNRQQCYCEHGEWSSTGDGCFAQGKKDPIWSDCDASTQCVQHAICNLVSHQCECEPGFVRRGSMCYDTRIHLGGTCYSDQPDRGQCGKNAECWLHDGCKCLEDYIPKENNIDCRPYRQMLGDQCHATFDCGRNAFCNSFQCVCQQNAFAAPNKIDCARKITDSCDENSQCVKNAKCQRNVCMCDTGYKPDSGNMLCSWNSDNCRKDIDCPLMAYCNLTDLTCNCQEGYEWKAGGESRQCKFKEPASIWSRGYFIAGFVILGIIVVGSIIGAIWRCGMTARTASRI